MATAPEGETGIFDPTTPAEALTSIEGYFDDLTADRFQFRDWCAGTADGGPNGNGEYPLTDFTGHTYMIPCPAKIAAIAGTTATDVSYSVVQDILDEVAAMRNAVAVDRDAVAADKDAVTAEKQEVEAARLAAALSEAAAEQAEANALTHASSSDVFAQASAGHATVAGSYADDAQAAAGVAEAHELSAKISAAYLLPPDFEQEGRFWFNGYNGSPLTVMSISDQDGIHSFAPGPEGKVLQIHAAVGQSVDVGQIGVVRVAADRKYRVTARWRTTVGTGSLSVWVIGLDGSYTYLAPASKAIDHTNAGVGIWKESSVELDGSTIIAAGAPYLRALVRAPDGSSDYEIAWIRTADITDVTLAGQYAEAASTSAESAGVYRDEASISAAAAQEQRVAAEAAFAGASDAAQQAQTALMPDRYIIGDEANFTVDVEGDPDDGNPAVANATLAGWGPVFQPGSPWVWAQRNLLSALPGRIYEIRVEAVISNIANGPVQFRAAFRTLDASYQTTGVGAVVDDQSIASNSTVEGICRVSDVADPANNIQAWGPGAIYLRPYGQLNLFGAATADIQFKVLSVRDITSRILAEKAASAAATHSQTAEAKATEASQYASAAQGSATTASTKAGEASASAGQAATSEFNAAGSATTATNQANLAASSSNAARLGASASFPSSPGQYPSQFIMGITENPATATGLDQYAGAAAVSDSLGSFIRYTGTAGYTHTRTRALIPNIAGRKWRITAKARRAEFYDPAQSNMMLGLTYYGVDAGFTGDISYGGWGVVTTPSGAINGVVPVDTSVHTLIVELECNGTTRPWIAPSLYAFTDNQSIGYANPIFDIYSYVVEDITSESASKQYAADALVSQQAAAQSKTDADGAASTASTQATVAANASSVAQTAKAAAQEAAKITLPDGFTDPTMWTEYNGWGGDTSITVGLAKTFNGGSFMSAGRMPVAVGQTYRVTARHRVVNQGGGQTYIGVFAFDANDSYLGVIWGNYLAIPSPPLNEWTTSPSIVTGDAVLAATPTAAYISPLLLMGYSNISDGECSMLRLENITSENAAAGSASAAATSASTASSKATEAGQYASSASSSANAAGVSEGNAANSASASANSAAAASGSESRAATSATVAASVNTGAINKNPMFAEWNNGIYVWPDHWNYDAVLGAGSSITRVTGEGGIGYSARLTAGAEVNAYNATLTSPINLDQWYVIEADFTLVSGDLRASGIYVSGQLYWMFETHTEDGQIAQIQSGTVGRTYRLRKMFKSVGTGVTGLYYMTKWSGFRSLTSLSATTIDWHKLLLRPASPVEVEMRKPGGISASVNVMQGALADISGRTSAYWQARTNSGAGTDAFIAARSDTSRPDLAEVTLVGVNATVEGRTLVKTTSDYNWSASITSQEYYPTSQGAYVAATAPADSAATAMIGVSYLVNTASYTDLLAWYFAGDGNWYIYSFGTSVAGPFSAKPTDRVEVIITPAGGFKLILNGEVKNEGTAGNFGETNWYLDSSIYTPGASFRDVVFAKRGPEATSSVSLGAGEVHIFNPTGEDWKKTLSVRAGQVEVGGNLSAETGIFLGSGNLWPVQLAQKSFQAADGEAVSFGVNLGNVPEFIFKGDNLAALAAGEAYKLYADSATGTGFTARMKIVTPGGSNNYSVTGANTNGFGLEIARGTNPEAGNGTYTYSMSANVSIYVAVWDTVERSGTVTFGIWKYVGGVWVKHTTLTQSWADFFTGKGTSTQPVNASGTFNLGSGVTYFGVSVDSYEGGTATLSSFGPVTWSNTATSGERSATPNGQKSSIIIVPR